MLAGNTSPLRRLFRGACVLAALALLIVAMAEPRRQLPRAPERARALFCLADTAWRATETERSHVFGNFLSVLLRE
jgi:hypothetical protein